MIREGGPLIPRKTTRNPTARQWIKMKCKYCLLPEY